MAANHSPVYGLCTLDQCSFVQENISNEITRKAVGHVCRFVGLLMENKGLLSADRGDLDPATCPIRDFMALDEETRQGVVPADIFGKLNIVKAIVDGGIF